MHALQIVLLSVFRETGSETHKKGGRPIVRTGEIILKSGDGRFSVHDHL
jgi:hypothetical protein